MKSQFNHQAHIVVTNKLINQLKKKAFESEYKHYRLCLHSDESAAVHQMIIVIFKEALFPPHRHPKGKAESIHLIEGDLKTYIFDDNGNIIQDYALSTTEEISDSLPQLIYRVEGGHWHLPVCLSDYAIYHEIYTGPYDKEKDIETPSWAPSIDQEEALRNYCNALRK